MKCDEIVNLIAEKTGMSKEEIERRIEEKKKELSNLISEDGVAHIVAKEFGISLVKRRVHTLKIKNIISNMHNVNVAARVLKKTEVSTFKRSDGTEGRVASLYVGDETGIIRVVLWDEETEILSALERGDVVRINNAYTRDNLGRVEIMLGRRGSIIKTDERLALPSADEIEARFDYAKRVREYEPAMISSIKKGASARIRACVVQLFKTQPLFFTCPVCGTRLEANENCKEHGKRSANLVISGIIDDGTGNMRFVAFREVAEKILNRTTAEVASMLSEGDAYERLFERANLGKDFIFLGYAKVNPLFERLEFVVNDIKDVDIVNEARRMLEEIEAKREEIENGG